MKAYIFFYKTQNSCTHLLVPGPSMFPLAWMNDILNGTKGKAKKAKTEKSMLYIYSLVEHH